MAFSFSGCWVGSQSYQIQSTIYHAPPLSRDELAPILGDFIRDVIAEILSEQNKSFFVEDNTWNVFFARELLELLPEAKLIHVYRDPRDVVASFSQQRWSPSNRIQAARWYRDMMQHWFEVRSGLPTHSYHELSLESLVASPREILTSICEFAGITFDEAMLEIDLSHSHTGRWKRECSDEEKIKIQVILGDVIGELGYEADGVET
jgi:hypothetical protein